MEAREVWSVGNINLGSKGSMEGGKYKWGSMRSMEGGKLKSIDLET